jgi:hypothetical protein
MKIRTLCALFLLCASVRAADLEPVSWYTATSQEVYVACFWAQQFPRFAQSAKHLLLACPKAKWTAANPAKKQAILTAIRRFLNGDDPVSAAKMQTIRDALADAQIGFVLTDDPFAQLAAWGLKPPTVGVP